MRVVLASVVLIGLSLASAFAGGAIFAAWVALGGVLMALEWRSIAFGHEGWALLSLHLVGLALIVAASLLARFELGLWSIGALSVLGFALVRFQGLRPAWAVVGLPYTLLPILSLLWLRQSARPPLEAVVWIFALVWASDIGAFLVGRAFGKAKLAPAISPHKTWAGLFGGVLAAAFVGLATGIAVEGASALLIGGLSGLLAVVSQLGDLTESAFKRRFGVKDSSQLIPGQGGVLDRVDGLIFVTLAVAALALLKGGDVLFREGRL